MKTLTKIAIAGVAGLAGYFIGFYEFKYKVMRAFTEAMIEKEEAKKSNEESTEESEEEA